MFTEIVKFIPKLFKSFALIKSFKKMKKLILSLIILCCLAVPSSGQPKLVLIEQFSNTACGPCAKFSPYLDSLLMVRQGEVISIRYHIHFPDSRDQFYLNAKEIVDKKVALYNITGVPSAIINGTQVPTSVTTISDKIDSEINNESSFKLNVNSSTENDKLNLKVSVTPLKNMTSKNVRLFVAIVEEEIYLETPSQNGEQHYYNILRNMLPDGDGYAFSEEFVQNQEKTFETSWGIQGFFDKTQLGIVAFLQNMDTKEVYEVTYAPRSSDQTDIGKVVLVQNVPDKICSPHFQPKIKFRNIGKNAITKAIINVSVNGSTQQTPWEGNLEYLENATIETPDFTEYTLTMDDEKNKAEIWLSDINGTDGSSEKYSVTFTNSSTVANSAKLTIFTDKKPEEITWKLFNSAGDIVDEGGPYEEARKFYEKMLNIESDDCYTIHFYDVGKDGIASSTNGNGYYKLEQINNEGKKTLILQGDYNTEEHIVNFKIYNVNNPNGFENVNTTPSLFIYNEKTGEVQFEGNNEMHSIKLYTLSGQKILEQQTTNKSIHLNVPDKGLYLLQVKTNSESITQQIMIK